MIPIVRKEVTGVNRPLKLEFSLLDLKCCEVFVHRAIEELKLLSKLGRREGFGYVFQELKVDLSMLESKVHTSSDHDMLRFVMLSIELKTLQLGIWVALDHAVLGLKVSLNLPLSGVSGPHVHSTRSIVKFMHHMCKDTVVALL